MREIKFRGKRTDNGEWVYGYLWINKSATIETVYITDEKGNILQVITETVGQYVEILDAYEGDLLHGSESDEYGSILSSWIGAVKWNEEKGRTMIQELKPMIGDWYEVDDFMFDKVIGNVFE